MTNYEEKDCTKLCKSKIHGDLIGSALTKRAVSDLELCSYINWVCCNCENADKFGRSAVHLAASCGRVDVLKWLIKTKNSQINQRDFESGYTPLHRSFFYGQINCGVTILNYGANFNQIDYDNLTPFEHLMKDNYKSLAALNHCFSGEVYVWGSNINYTFGVQQERNHPELLDIFHRENPNLNVHTVCLDKFHCVLLTVDGKAYSCGHGQGGRLGLNNEQTQLKLQQISFQSNNSNKIICKQACIGRDHSVFLTDAGQVYTCGLNKHHILGHYNVEKVLAPKPLGNLKHNIQGICCGRFHTVLWGEKCILTFGLNAGQLGHDKDAGDHVIKPKFVNNITQGILSVDASDGCTCLAKANGDICIFYDYQIKKVATKMYDVAIVKVIGGKLSKVIDCHDYVATDLKIALLTKQGNLYLWQQTDPQFRRCLYSINRPIVVKQLHLNKDELLFVTQDGEAFYGKTKPRSTKTQIAVAVNNKEKSAFHKFVEKDECAKIKLIKIPNCHRAIAINSDSNGGNYAVIQVRPTLFIDQPHVSSSSNIATEYMNFYKEIDKYDQLHDVVFTVKNKKYYGHCFILANHSKEIERLIQKNYNSAIPVQCVLIDDLDSLYFEELLEFIYTGDCDLLRPGQLPECFLNEQESSKTKLTKSNKQTIDFADDLSAFEAYKLKEDKQKKKNGNSKCMKDPVRKLGEIAKKYGVYRLVERLKHFYVKTGLIENKKIRDSDENSDSESDSFKDNRTEKSDAVNSVHFEYKHDSFKYLYDVNIKTIDNKIVKAHKCILAARLEYFNNLFSLRWNEKSTKTEISLPITENLIWKLLDFLYTDQLNASKEFIEDMDSVCNLLVLSDQLFIIRLKELCENILIKYHVTLKSVVEMLKFSKAYNADNLKNYCLEYVCVNLTCILESRQLERLIDDEDNEVILNDLTEFYCNWNPIISQRIITPYFYAVDDESVMDIHQNYPVTNLKNDINCTSGSGSSKSQKKRRSKTGKGNLSREEKLIDIDKTEDYFDEQLNNSSTLSDIENPKNDSFVTKNYSFVTRKDDYSSPKSNNISIKSRLGAIKNVQDSLITNFYEYKDEFTSLNSLKLNNDDEFPDLIKSPINPSNVTASSPASSSLYSKSPGKSMDFHRHKITKISQKQRKRLSSENSNGNPPESPSFDEKYLAESPKNPWKVIEPTFNCSTSPSEFSYVNKSRNNDMNEIINETKLQKANYNKMKTKQLIYTQMEDKALEELSRFYNIENVHDEIITAHRVETDLVAAPVWIVQKTK